MTDWQTGDIAANGIQIHYSRSTSGSGSGSGKPSLLLLHGATDNGMCWEPVAQVLAADFDVILPDARGHGRSTAPQTGYTSVERAADAAALITGLHLERPAVGGHSMGAQTAFRLAVDYPQLVRCAILEDPPFRDPGAGFSAVRNRMRDEIARWKTMSYDHLLEVARTERAQWPADELPAWADAKLHVSEAFMNSMGERMAEQPWVELVPRLACPTLLITADPERGAIVTPETAAEVARLNPQVEVVRLSGAGHNIRREQRDGFLTAVRQFLADTESRATA